MALLFKACPQCGQRVPENVGFCPTCSYAFGQQAGPQYGPQYGQPPAQGFYYRQAGQAAQRGNGFSIAALVLGIVSLLFWCFWFFSLPTGILGIVFGCVGLKSEERGMAIGGIVCGCIGVAIGLAWLVIFVAAMASAHPR